MGKASQKLLSKQRNKKPPSDGSKRIFLDVFALKKRPKYKTVMTNPNWIISCDHESGLQMTEFCLTKDGMVEPTLAKFDQFRQAGIDISHLQMDDAGEKKSPEKEALACLWKFNINFEHSRCNAPQGNIKVERAVATCGRKITVSDDHSQCAR